LHAVRGELVRWITDNGKSRFEPVPNSAFEKKTEMVILAMGFLHPRHDGLLNQLGVLYDQRGNLLADTKTMMSSMEGVFGCGDAVTGPWIIAGAIAGGRRLAREIDIYLTGSSSLPITIPLPDLKFDP
jgi:glutamate synthase (NADPH/NADH) small chain